MQLKKSLRLSGYTSIAFVGSGGKSSILFSLAKELVDIKEGIAKSVIVTATTHLSVSQLQFADHHIVIEDRSELIKVADNLPAGIFLITGSIGQDQRTAGLDLTLMDAIYEIATLQKVPLLIEADGSRQKPLKAPAPHEPVIPEWIDIVVTVVGIKGIGRKLTPQNVHRPNLFADLAGLKIGDQITYCDVVKVLSHPQGGIKGVPDHALRVLCINQADTTLEQSLASRMGYELLSVYNKGLVSSLSPRNSISISIGSENLPVNDSKVVAVIEKTAAIILAAGESSRFGQPKQLLMWQGEAMVRSVALTALSSNLQDVFVVTGAHAEDVESKLSDLNLKIVPNPDWASGQGTSVQAGVKALSSDFGAVVFLLADQPLVNPVIIRRLVEYHAENLSPIIAPLVDDKRANPVLFDRLTFRDLMALSGDMGGRAIFSRFPVAWLPWYDRGLLFDIDKPDDYHRLLSDYQGPSTNSGDYG